MWLEIERAFGLFDGLALDGMGVNHGCPYIAVPQQLLNRTDIVICLQQMACPASAGWRKVWAEARLGIFDLLTAFFMAF